MADMLATFGLDDSEFRKGLAAVEAAGKRTAARMTEGDRFWEKSRKVALGYSGVTVAGLGAVSGALLLARNMVTSYVQKNPEFENAINGPFKQMEKLNDALAKYITLSLSNTGGWATALSDELDRLQDGWTVILNMLSGERDPIGAAVATRRQLMGWDQWAKDAPNREAREAITQRNRELDLLRHMTTERQLQSRITIAMATNNMGEARQLSAMLADQQRISAELESQLELRKELQRIGKQEISQTLKDQQAEQAKTDAAMKLSAKQAEIDAAARAAELDRQAKADGIRKSRLDIFGSLGQADDDRRRALADVLRTEAARGVGLTKLRIANRLDLESRIAEINREYETRKAELMAVEENILSNPERVDMLNRLKSGRDTDLRLAERQYRANAPFMSGVIGPGVGGSPGLLSQVFGNSQNNMAADVRGMRDSLSSIGMTLNRIEKNTQDSATRWN